MTKIWEQCWDESVDKFSEEILRRCANNTFNTSPKDPSMPRPLASLLEAHNIRRANIEDRSVSRQFEKVVHLEDNLTVSDLSKIVIVDATV